MNLYKIIIICLLSILLLAEKCSDNSIIKGVVVLPNPVNDHCELVIELAEETELNIRIHNSIGDMVLEPAKSVNYSAGEARIPIQTSALPSGTYMIMINNSKEMLTEKMLVVH